MKQSTYGGIKQLNIQPMISLGSENNITGLSIGDVDCPKDKQL